MQYNFKNKRIQITAETEEENTRLLEFIHGFRARGGNRKTHSHKKECGICGKKYKGNVGLGIHMSKAHPKRSTTSNGYLPNVVEINRS